jgi:hypothetical protein
MPDDSRSSRSCAAGSSWSRWARGKPALLQKRPALPVGWVPVLERHPEGFVALPGYVWLDVLGKVRLVGEHELDFTNEPPRA